MIRGVAILECGDHPERDRLNPTRERSLKHSLKALVDSGDVASLGKGGQLDPYRYTTIEAFAALVRFEKREGNCLVLHSHKEEGYDRNLGRWVSTQRTKRAGLSPEQIERLEALSE